MKKVTLNVPENKYQNFLELIQNVEYINVRSTETTDENLVNLAQGFQDLKQHDLGPAEVHKPINNFFHEA